MPFDLKQLQAFQQGFAPTQSPIPTESEEDRLLREQQAIELQNAKIRALKQMLSIGNKGAITHPDIVAGAPGVNFKMPF